ncbi:MAG: DUF5050 domain-containing protein [Pyrinomonadaceae bacterium]|nr:DUF5050 domain-containing protein [Pyrinomonadaceae bacterium]
MKNLLLAIAVFSLLNIAPVVIKAQAPADFQIAYNVLVDKEADDYDVFIMNADGSEKRNITNHKDVAWTYYAYENTIYFISDRGACKRCYFLYSMDTDGKNIKKITDLQLEDSWMSARQNGSELVVAGRIGKEVRNQLFVIDINTGTHRQITNDPDGRFRDPLFSPDGSKIFFVYKKRKQENPHSGELFVMNADGKNKKQLTKYPANDKSAGKFRYRAGPPRWNSKGKFISYQSVQNGKSSLFAITPDGKKKWKLTDNKLNEGWHDWTPDGKWLAVEMWDDKRTSYGIHLMNYETKETMVLTDKSKYQFQQAPVFVKEDPLTADRAELLRLHKQHQTAHLTYNADLFVETFAETLPQIQRGEVSLRNKAENLTRIKSYFKSYKFLEWQDVKPPIIRISKDGTMATKIVEKRVSGTYKNEKGEPIKDLTEFAWLEVWEKIEGKWKVVTVASTRKPVSNNNLGNPR